VLDDLSTGRAVNLDDVRSDVELIDGDVRDAQAVAAAVTGAAVARRRAVAEDQHAEDAPDRRTPEIEPL
jgi:hypothetical protein